MRNIWIIAKREYKHFFISPIAYVIAFMFFLVLGLIFYTNILSALQYQLYGYNYAPTLEVVLSPMITLLLFTTPALTMRTISEEQRMGTLELLLTSPVRDWELIVGKWLGSFLFILTLIGMTLVFPAILNQMVDPGIDQGLMVSGYLGLILLSGAFLAIGVAVSSLFNNQIAAFFLTLAILLVVWMISYPAQAAGQTTGLLYYLDFSEHIYSTFYEGIIQITDVVFFLSVTALALIFGTVNVEARRWR